MDRGTEGGVTMFHIGQKVVCVDASDTQRYCTWVGLGGMDGLTEGVIYTIRKTGLFGGVPCVWLNEIVRPVLGSLGAKEGECGYAPQRFRLVAERKTDAGMAILREILDRESHQDRVPEKTRP